MNPPVIDIRILATRYHAEAFATFVGKRDPRFEGR